MFEPYILQALFRRPRQKYVATYIHVGVSDPVLLLTNVRLNGLPDGQLTRTLTDLRQVSTAKAMRGASQEINVHILYNNTFTSLQIIDFEL
jgi:hypothetical protein